MVVSITVIFGAGITVTTIVFVTAKHGVSGLAVNTRSTVPDVIVGVYVLDKEFILLNYKNL